jgi:DNA polymerase lambda
VTFMIFSSHVGFLPKFVQRLKEMNFLREDRIFSIHSVEVSY